MRRLFRPYQLLLLATVSVAMIFFMKIDKLSFYHHFFKVIEEVELRNSQQIQAAGPIETIWWAIGQEVKGPALAFLLFLLWLSGPVIAGLPGLAQPVTGEPLLPRYRRPWALLPPVRAP